MPSELIKITGLHLRDLREFRGAVKTRIAERQKALWSRFIGAGFVKEDIQLVWPESNMNFFSIDPGHGLPHSYRKLTDCNLRELDELLKWLEDYVPESGMFSTDENAKAKGQP